MDFVEWASNRTLSIGRSYAKEILNTLRLSQSNRYAVCKACRGLSLEDFCNAYGMNPYEEAKKIDSEFYLKMQIADYLLNNNDRHEQNWGFFMDNHTGKLFGYCPLSIIIICRRAK